MYDPQSCDVVASEIISELTRLPDYPEVVVALAHWRGTGAQQERRKDIVRDHEADRIRQAAERISGIGEQTAWDLAAEFNSLDELRRADRGRLKEIPNVGPQRARALQE